MNILIVDDNEANRYLLESLLKGNGHHVVSVTNGSEAIEQLHRGRMDLVISDILMPVMDGFELCRKMRSDNELRSVPFIVYTATYTGPQDEEFALKIGANRFIQKPCEPDILIQIINEVIASAKNRNVVSDQMEPKEENVLKLYNERLIRNLEQKMFQLEKEVQTRKKIEETLRISEEKYRSLYNCIRDAILVGDIDKNIIDCNPAFIELFGYSLDEICGKKVAMIFENDYEYKPLSDILEDHTPNKDYLCTMNFKKKNGDIFPGEINLFHLNNDSGICKGFICLIRDITIRNRLEKIKKDLETQLYQAQKMESIGRLATGIAHDFNNLLSVILGYGEIVLEDLEKKHPLYGMIEQIMEAGNRAKELTRQLLAFSRKQVLEIKKVDINVVINNFQKLLRRLIGEHTELVLKFSSEPLIVKADTTQLEQVIMNLSINAHDAMPTGGTLTIETSSIELDTTDASRIGMLSGKYAIINVRDTGCGIDKNNINRIFEPFFTTKDKERGTGLGLATSYGIIKQHGGNILVESEPGKGSLFTIYLPICSISEDVPSETVKGFKPDIQSPTALILENYPAVRELICQILTRHGFLVIESKSPTDAIEKAKTYHKPIHLVITDVMMPKMTGPEAFAKIRETHPEAKVLYISGHADTLISSHRIQNGGIQFIQKPFTVEDLLEKCYHVIRQN